MLVALLLGGAVFFPLQAAESRMGVWDVRLEDLLQRPERRTVELLTPAGRRVGAYEAILLWDVLRPAAENIADTLYRELALVVESGDGRQVVLSAVEVLPQAGLPPLLLLRAVHGKLGDTVRVPVRGNAVELNTVEAALAPAIRMRYRLRTHLEGSPVFQFPALVVGTDQQPWRWLSAVRRIELVRLGSRASP